MNFSLFNFDDMVNDQKSFFTFPPLPDKAAVCRSSEHENSHTPNVSEIFTIPDNLSPAWQTFFDKIAGYFTRKSLKSKEDLLQLVERSRMMREQNLSEFEMLMCSADFTQSVCLALVKLHLILG